MTPFLLLKFFFLSLREYRDDYDDAKRVHERLYNLPPVQDVHNPVEAFSAYRVLIFVFVN